jgi:serine/threonine protein kinase
MAPRTDPAVFHYRLGQKIGEGGMGIVYRATDKRLQREVAINSSRGGP